MEWFIFALLSVVGLNYRKIQRYFCIRKNLKGIKSVLRGCDASKCFYVNYLELIYANGIPHIQIKVEDGVILPDHLCNQDTVCLNVNPISIRNLKFKMDTLLFFASFNRLILK